MDIVKRLRISGNETNAVLIKDGDMEYPVFMESLLNTVIMPELLNSGWQYCGMPYDFRKDGLKLSDMPVEDFNPSVEEQQEMWDLIGDKLSAEELKANITEAAVNYLETPPADYKINTRDEFLKYLEDSDRYVNENDFLPINYFVHPSALFTVEEYTSGQFSQYTEILERRRRMSYTKFNKLISWCLSKGLTPSFSQMDFLDFYYQWGVDGLYLPLIAKKREMLYKPLGAGFLSLEMNSKQNLLRREIGLMDKAGTILVPEKSQNMKWEPLVLNQQVLDGLRASIPMDETRVMDLVCKITGEKTTMEGLECTIQYDPSTILIGSHRYSNFAVMPRDVSHKPISPDNWNPSKRDDVRTSSYLRALANEVVKRAIVPTSASSIKALTLSGCTPRTALYYYILSQKLNKKEKKDEGDDSMPIITLDDADDFIDGKLKSGDKYEILKFFLDGVSNIDLTYAGEIAEESYNSDAIYKELYTIHHILGVPLDELHDRIMNIGDAQSICFEGNGYRHTLSMPIIDAKMRNYSDDIMAYRIEALDHALEYVYVTKTARESGGIESRRHIALECLVLFMNQSAKILVSELREKFIKRIEEKVIGLNAQEKCKDAVPTYAAEAFFEIALRGTITYPEVIGGGVEHVDNNTRMLYRNQLRSRIDSTFAYCNSNVQEDGRFRRFCVNAYITPEYVIPLGQHTILESSFIALWRDFSNSPTTRAKLIDKGLIPENHVPWTNRYYEDSLCVLDMLSNKTLDYYDEQSNRFRKQVAPNEEFNSVPHMLEYLCPDLYAEDAFEPVTTDAPIRQGLPNFCLGEPHYRTIKDYEDILSVDAERSDVAKVGFQPFNGYDADDFYLVPDVLNTDYDAAVENSIMVFPPYSFSTLATGTKQYTDISSLDQSKYPVRNIRGRKYVVRDAKGQMWEVNI